MIVIINILIIVMYVHVCVHHISVNVIIKLCLKYPLSVSYTIITLSYMCGMINYDS